MTSLLHLLRTRLPSRREMFLALGVVLFAVFGWSIRGFLYKLPSFSLYFGLGSNLAILSYMMAFAFVESLLVTGLLILLAILLPSAWFRSGFAYKSFIIMLVATVASILFENWYKADFFKDILAGMTYPFPPFLIGLLGSIAVLGFLLWLVARSPIFQRALLDVIERISLFTYIYVPVGLVGLVVVFLRNL